MIPAIDHSLLSPSGHMSKRARQAALKRETGRLFAGVSLKGEVAQPSERERLLRQAKTLRDLASRGMKPRAYAKEADRLEALANNEPSEPKVTP